MMMAKPKFDLTSDIVEVTQESVTATPTNYHSKLEKSETSSKVYGEQILLTIAVEKDVRDEFKVWCAQNKLKMREAFLKGFELLKASYK